MAYPINRNQRPYLDLGGVRYTYDPITGQYRAPNGAAFGTNEQPGGPTVPEQEMAPAPGYTWDALGQVWRGPNGAAWGTTEGPGGPTVPDAEIPASAGNKVPPPPTSYDPPAGGPTYTPGISFGQGQLPGVNPAGPDTYQRQWFDVGPDAGSESINNITYDTAGTGWGLAWNKVMNQFGGMPGGDFNKWLANFSGQAQGDYQNTVPYAGGKLHVSDFLDQYAPQIKGVYDLMPGQAKGRGGRMPLAGRSNY